MKSLFRRLTAADAPAKAKGIDDLQIQARLAFGNGLAMDARTNSQSGLPSRHVAEGAKCAPLCCYPVVTTFAEIFKKTRYVPDLKPRGRYVAKDLSEVGSRPVLKKTLLDNDADIGSLDVKLTDAVLAEHKTKWTPRKTNHTSGAPGRHARQMGAAVDGAVTHRGAHEKQCYADI